MLVSVFLYVCLLLSGTYAAKILAVFMTPSYSHQIVFQPIWRELSLRGHQVTVYTPNPLNDPSLTNLTEYDMGFSYEPIKALHEAGEDFDKLFSIFKNIADLQLSQPYMRDLIKNVNNETYDLFLVKYLWQSMYAFKEIYKVPMIGITSLPLAIGASDALGMDKHPVLDPNYLLQFSYAETFQQRLISWTFKWLFRFIATAKYCPKVDEQVKRHFGQGIKSVTKIAREVSIVLGNYNFAIQNVKPFVPSYIPISGIHVQPQKPLPTGIAKTKRDELHVFAQSRF